MNRFGIIGGPKIEKPIPRKNKVIEESEPVASPPEEITIEEISLEEEVEDPKEELSKIEPIKKLKKKRSYNKRTTEEP